MNVNPSGQGEIYDKEGRGPSLKARRKGRSKSDLNENAFQKCVEAQEIQLEQISCSWTCRCTMCSATRSRVTDDYEGVRFEALTILDATAETDPEYQVEFDTGASRSVVGGQTIGMVDDVFSRTCQGACEGTGGPADRGYEGREPGLPRDPGQEADEQHEDQEECT